jgi:5-carboxymethyl-2-hydroxymuconate isomerase
MPSPTWARLCNTLAATLVALRGEDGVAPLFPVAGTRVMAWPAPHFAVADGRPGRAFIYLNLLITPGRSEALKKRAGDALLAAPAHTWTRCSRSMPSA